jgi:hypothetical protein
VSDTPNIKKMDRTTDPHLGKQMPVKVLKRPLVPSSPGPRSSKTVNPRSVHTTEHKAT